MAEVAQTIWNGRLAGTPNSVYYDFINVDPSAPAFSKRKRNSSFFLDKRKGYKRISFGGEGLEKYATWNVKDVQRISDLGCGDGDCYNFFLLVNPSGDKMTVLFASCENCEEEEPQFCQIEFTDDDGTTKTEFRTCGCSSNKFVVTDFAKGKPRDMDGAGKYIGVGGTQINYSPNDNTPALGRFSWGETFAWDQTVTLGDYLYVWKSRNQDGDGYCGQVRQVLGYQDPSGSDNYLNMSSPWLGFGVDQEEGDNLTFSIFPEWGKVIGFYTFDGLYLIHHVEQSGSGCDSFVSLVCDYGTSFTGTKKCANSIVEHLGRVNILFDNGYNAFGEQAYNKFFITTDTQAYLGTDKLTIASFRNYLLGFGESEVSVTTFTGSTAVTDNISTNVGLWSNSAYTQFDNSFYFVGNDKRLHTLSIKSDGVAYLLEMDDVSDFIRGELDLIQPTDEVFINADGRRMIIFICGSNGESSFNSKTKMLIFDRDYNIRHKHYLCCGALNGFGFDYYFGDGLYRYCGDQDCNGEYIESKIVAFVGEEEVNGMDFMLFKRKKLSRAKLMLGKGIYTNENTQFTVTMYRNGSKYSYVVDDIENIKRIQDNNSLAQGTPIEPSDCLKDDMGDCFVFDRPCEGSPFSEQDESASSLCGCPIEKTPYDDYCNCVDDKGYFVSDIYPVWIPLQDIRESDLYRVELRSGGGDQLSFGGFILGVEQRDIDIHDPDMQDEWSNSNCCSAQMAKPRSCG